jgi:hypothetical protein
MLHSIELFSIASNAANNQEFEFWCYFHREILENGHRKGITIAPLALRFIRLAASPLASFCLQAGQ